MKESVKVLLTEEEVDKKIYELGARITRDYEGKRLHLVCVLKGELISHLQWISCRLQAMKELRLQVISI